MNHDKINDFKIKSTTSDDSDFQNLVKLLDEELAIRDGSDYSFYAQFNKLDAIKNVVVCYVKDAAVGCGALKEFDNNTIEIKRMFVHPDNRRQGIASSILHELELWAAEKKYSVCILETGKNQPEAIQLYQKELYTIIPNYGPYKNVDNSVCMKKIINPNAADAI